MMKNFRCIAVVGAMVFATSAMAQTGPDLLLEQFEKDKSYNLSGDITVLFNGNTDNSSADFGMTMYESKGRMKLDLGKIIPGIDRAQPRAGYELVVLDLDTNDPSLPGQFVDVSVGAGMGIAAGEKWKAGLTLGVGYASSSVFDDGNAYYGKADLAVGYDIDETTQLGIVLSYDGNRPIFPDTPLPGFLYRKRLNDQTSIGIGFPFSSIEWKPDSRWTLKFKYLMPDFVTANVEYALSDNFAVFADLDARTYAFHWDELDRGDDRILFKQKRAELGVRGTIDDRFSFIAAGGYAFGGVFEAGFDLRESDEVAEISDEPYVRLAVEMKF